MNIDIYQFGYQWLSTENVEASDATISYFSLHDVKGNRLTDTPTNRSIEINR